MSTGPLNSGPLSPGGSGFPGLTTGGGAVGAPGTSRFGVQLGLIGLFLLLSGLASVGIRFWRSTPPAEVAKKTAVPKYSLVLAATDLDVGREIRSADYYTMSVEKPEYDKLSAGKLTFGSAKDLVGRIIRKKVPTGAAFTLDCLYPAGTGPTPADLLSDGMRAVTVRMGLVGGLRGFVSPESWVDVLLRRTSAQSAPDSTRAARTHTLFPGVRVLGIQDSLYPETVLAKDARGNMAEKFEVTLELTPAQCEVLKSIEDRVELSLNMLPKQEGRSNSGNVPEPEIMKILLGVQPPEVPVVVVPPPTVRVIRGGNASQVAVDQIVDTIIDSSVYPAPVPNSGDAVPLPGSQPGGAGAGEEVWPVPSPPIAPPPSNSDPVSSGDAADQTQPGPGATRTRGSVSDATLVRNLSIKNTVPTDRAVSVSTNLLPQTRRVFNVVGRSSVPAPRRPIPRPVSPRQYVASPAYVPQSDVPVRTAPAAIVRTSRSARPVLGSGSYYAGAATGGYSNPQRSVPVVAVRNDARPMVVQRKPEVISPALSDSLHGMRAIAMKGSSRIRAEESLLPELKVGRR